MMSAVFDTNMAADMRTKFALIQMNKLKNDRQTGYKETGI